LIYSTPEASAMKRDRDKLRELILYVAEKSAADPHFGLTKLYKILFYCDFEAYARYGAAITGCPYKKLPHGPVPADGEELLRELQASGELAIAHRVRYGYDQRPPRSLRDADLSAFTGEEIALVHEILGQLWPLSAREVSDLSHNFIGWRAARVSEVIPYETGLIDHGPLPEEVDEWCRSLVEAGL
jgi:hypothetical protein